MTTTLTSGAADLPEALRSIQRFEVVDCIDDKHVPAVIHNPHGPWVRYEDHIAALAAGQATAAQPDDMGYKSIDMVLHCPKCGMQHIDEDNYEELRIEAAELGVDREGERELERWIEEREWSNPPHRSHLCQNRKCGHIWRPADVPTNGVAAIKTAGTKDGPITSPSVEFQILKAEHDNLKSSYGRLKLAYDAWHEKTNWIHKTIKPAELGQHIADVMTARLLCLGDGPKPLTGNPNEL